MTSGSPGSMREVTFLAISRKSVLRFCSRVKSGQEYLIPHVSSFAKCLGKFMGESSGHSKSGFWHIFGEILDFSKFFKNRTGGRFYTINVAILVYRKSAFQKWKLGILNQISEKSYFSNIWPLPCSLALPALPCPALPCLQLHKSLWWLARLTSSHQPSSPTSKIKVPNSRLVGGGGWGLWRHFAVKSSRFLCWGVSTGRLVARRQPGKPPERLMELRFRQGKARPSKARQGRQGRQARVGQGRPESRKLQFFMNLTTNLKFSFLNPPFFL